MALALCAGLLSGCAGYGGNAADNASGNRGGSEAGNKASSDNTVPGNTVPVNKNVTVQWREGLKVSYVLPEDLKGPDELSPQEKELFFGYDEAVCAYTFSGAEENLLVYHIGSERELEGLTAEQRIGLAERSGFLVTDETVEVRRERLENTNGCEVWKCTYAYEFGDDNGRGSGDAAYEGVPGVLAFTDYRYYVSCGEFFCSFGVFGSGHGPSDRSSLAEQYSGSIAQLFKSMSIDSSSLHFAYDPKNDSSDETPFFYGLMDEEDKAIYKEIEAALDVQKLKAGQDISYSRKFESEEEKDRYWRILECVAYEHPENIFFPSEWGNSGRQISVLYRCTPDRYNDGEIEKRLGWLRQIEETSDRIIAEMPQNLTRYGKYLYIAREMNSLVEYDYSDLDATIVQEDPGYPSSLIGVYIYGKAVCEGYAQAYAYLCKRAGLFCTELIAGDHAWNIIRLGGELYYFDPTWMDDGDRNWFHPNNFDDMDQDHRIYLEHIQFRNSDWQPSVDAAKKTGGISWAKEQ